jgi:hypothetical protein
LNHKGPARSGSAKHIKKSEAASMDRIARNPPMATPRAVAFDDPGCRAICLLGPVGPQAKASQLIHEDCPAVWRHDCLSIRD